MGFFSFRISERFIPFLNSIRLFRVRGKAPSNTVGGLRPQRRHRHDHPTFNKSVSRRLGCAMMGGGVVVIRPMEGRERRHDVFDHEWSRVTMSTTTAVIQI